MYNDCRKGSEFMDKKKEKKNFRVEGRITCEEYQKYYRYLPNILWDLLQQSSLYIIIFLLTIGILLQWDLLEFIGALVFFILSFSIYYFIKRKKIISDEYYESIENGILDEEVNLDFYDTYFVCNCLHYTYLIEYSKIQKIIETDTNFYIITPIHDFIIVKTWCNKKEYTFFRKLCDECFIDKQKQDTKKGKKKKLNKEQIDILLNILLIATLFSGIFSFYIFANAVYHVPVSLQFQYAWIYWILLIIPILSIVFGFKYKNVVKTKYNIIAGFIMGILLLILACYFTVPSIDKTTYSSVKEYQNILHISIPKNGYYYKDKQELHFLYNFDGISVSSINAYYKDKIIFQQLDKEIKKNTSWLSYSDLDEVEKMLPYELRSKKHYYLIYNKTTEEYNIVPDKEGKYSFVTAVYVPKVQQLEIYEYNLDYTK